MAVVSGCVHAVASTGGRAKQCTDTVTSTLYVKAGDKLSSELMPCCAKHAAQLAERHYGSIYRENSAGIGQPVRIRLVDQ